MRLSKMAVFFAAVTVGTALVAGLGLWKVYELREVMDESWQSMARLTIGICMMGLISAGCFVWRVIQFYRGMRMKV